MNVDNAAENLPSLQRPDVLVLPLRENTVRAVSLWRLLSLKTFTGPPQAHS